MTPTTAGDTRRVALNGDTLRHPAVLVAVVVGLVGLIAPLRVLTTRGGDVDGLGMLIPGLLLAEVGVYAAAMIFIHRLDQRWSSGRSDFSTAPGWLRGYFVGSFTFGIALCAAPLAGYSWAASVGGLLIAGVAIAAATVGASQRALVPRTAAVSIIILTVSAGAFLLAPILYAVSLTTMILATRDS